MNIKTKRIELGVATTFAVAAFALSKHIVRNPEMAEAMSRGIATPMTWPKIMLSGVALFAIIWGVRSLYALYRARHPRGSTRTGGAADITHQEQGTTIALPPRAVALGILLALGYAFAIPWLGFTVATLAFLSVWFFIGGIRHPLRNGPVVVLGTIVILYVFVKLAMMPLDRGAGAMSDLTVALFHILHIY